MVPRTELLAAQSEAKALQDEVQAKANDVAWMESQLAKAQEQLNKARQEAAQLRADMSVMVQRTDLDKLKEQHGTLQAALALEGQQLRDSIAALSARLAASEAEKGERESAIKVPAGLRSLAPRPSVSSIRVNYLSQPSSRPSESPNSESLGWGTCVARDTRRVS